MTAARGLLQKDAAAQVMERRERGSSLAGDTEEELRDLDDDEAMTHRALEILGSHRNDAYQAALAELRDDTRGWWADVLAGDVAVLDDGREEIWSAPAAA